MTTPDLASAVRATITYLGEFGRHPVAVSIAIEGLELALVRHGAQSGEVVRCDAWRCDNGHFMVIDEREIDDVRDMMRPCDFIVTFHAPPKRETPVVEAEVCDGE